MITVRIEGILPSNTKYLRQMFDGLEKQDFKPNFNKLARDTGIVKATLYDNWSRIRKGCDIDCTIIIKEKL